MQKRRMLTSLGVGWNRTCAPLRRSDRRRSPSISGLPVGCLRLAPRKPPPRRNPRRLRLIDMRRRGRSRHALQRHVVSDTSWRLSLLPSILRNELTRKAVSHPNADEEPRRRVAVAAPRRILVSGNEEKPRRRAMKRIRKSSSDTAKNDHLAPADAGRGVGAEPEGESFAKWSTCEKIMSRDSDIFRRLAKA